MIDDENRTEQREHPVEEERPAVEPGPLPTAEETVYPEELPSPAEEAQTAQPQAWVEPQAWGPAQAVQPPVWQGYPQPVYGAPPQAYPAQQAGQPVVQPGYPQASPVQQPYPYHYGAPQGGYAQPPVYGQPSYYANPNGGCGYPVQPKKKKLSTGLKVFIWVASILAALSFLGFGGYLAYNAVNNLSFNSPGGSQPGGFGFPAPSIPSPYDSPDEQDPGGRDETPDGDDPDDGDDAPDFDEDVTPPDASDPLPEVDVTPNNEGIQISKQPQGGELSAKEAYKKVVKSTVTVAVSLDQNGTERTGTGTGIIATSDGYIITNSHVVMNSKSSRVKITTYDGEEYDAVVVGTDRTTDLAILKTNDHNFTPAEFGDTEQLEIGDEVIAIGNPGGAKFSGSMTAGYVSGLDRAVGKYSESGMTYLQTDAAINPGNSGGPLVNMYGQVVAINSSKIVADGYEGMAFAIPVSKAQPIINELLSGGYVKGRVRLGITGQNTAGSFYGFNTAPGFLIVAIDEDSAFQGTDAQAGDVITAIDGEAVASLEEMSNLLLKYSPGDRATITLNRNGKEFDVEITLLEDKGETQK